MQLLRIIYFLFSVRKSSKMAKICQKWKKGPPLLLCTCFYACTAPVWSRGPHQSPPQGPKCFGRVASVHSSTSKIFKWKSLKNSFKKTCCPFTNYILNEPPDKLKQREMTRPESMQDWQDSCFCESTGWRDDQLTDCKFQMVWCAIITVLG